MRNQPYWDLIVQKFLSLIKSNEEKVDLPDFSVAVLFQDVDYTSLLFLKLRNSTFINSWLIQKTDNFTPLSNQMFIVFNE